MCRCSCNWLDWASRTSFAVPCLVLPVSGSRPRRLSSRDTPSNAAVGKTRPTVTASAAGRNLPCASWTKNANAGSAVNPPWRAPPRRPILSWNTWAAPARSARCSSVASAASRATTGPIGRRRRFVWSSTATWQGRCAWATPLISAWACSSRPIEAGRPCFSSRADDANAKVLQTCAPGFRGDGL